jgi:hypothetical protein
MRPVKDKNFITIGFIDEQNGRKVVYDRDFTTLGSYDSKSNRTLNRDFTTRTFGDTSATLLKNKK